jgi:hypothetical protein
VQVHIIGSRNYREVNKFIKGYLVDFFVVAVQVKRGMTKAMNGISIKWAKGNYQL